MLFHILANVIRVQTVCNLNAIQTNVNVFMLALTRHFEKSVSLMNNCKCISKCKSTLSVIIEKKKLMAVKGLHCKRLRV